MTENTVVCSLCPEPIPAEMWDNHVIAHERKGQNARIGPRVPGQVSGWDRPDPEYFLYAAAIIAAAIIAAILLFGSTWRTALG